MLKSLLTITFLSIVVVTTAQDNPTTASKQFYTEAGGPGVLFSANFDSRFKSGERTGWGFRAGAGFTLADEESIEILPGGQTDYYYRTRTIFTIPLGINYVFGKQGSPNMFEVGAGATVLTKKASVLNYNDYNEGNLLGHFNFMYRRQPLEGGFSWRVGFTPIINPDGDIFPFAAIGIGFSFK